MQSIGERLEEARKRKGVTIREASEATKIRGDYLASFENNNFSINVPEIYVRGFLRSYSNFLKVNSEKIITDYAANLIGEAKSAKREHREFFGRMELQQPLVQDQAAKKTTTIVDEDVRSAAESDDRPMGIMGYFTNIEKDVLIKGSIVAVAAIICLVGIIWVVRVALSDGSGAATADNRPSSQMVPASSEEPAAESETIRLHATGDVRVSVTETKTGKTLLSLRPMVAGQDITVTKTGPITIQYTAGENLQVEVKGKLYSTGKTGENYSSIP